MSKEEKKVSISDMINWKKMWNDILSDPDFRYWFIGKSGGYYQLFADGTIQNDTPKRASPKKGTFYMQFGKEAHFVAYEKKAKSILIFDPSHSIGNEQGSYAPCLSSFEGSIRENFSPTINFVQKFGTPQTLEADTFCQTWSLSYLMGSTQKIMNKLKPENKPLNEPINKIEIIFELCKKIIGSDVFKEICSQQEKWITTAFELNKSPMKWTPKFFLEFSRNMTFDMFKLIF